MPLSKNKFMSPIDRFWSAIIRGESLDACWGWRGGGFGPQNRPAIKKHGVRIYAARFSWELSFGPIPEGMLVLHKCDNPRCTNPRHLFLGTQSENLYDSVAKGRYNKEARASHGEANGSARISEEDVREIRRLYVKGKKGLITMLAKRFEITTTQVRNIGKRKSWRLVQ